MLDILKLRNWSHTSVGSMASRTVNHALEKACADRRGQRILLLGFTAPYVHLWEKEAHVTMAYPSWMGAVPWPESGLNQSVLVHEDSLPFQDETFDVIIVSHVLEHSFHEDGVMREIWRTLKSESGQLIILTANRLSNWSRRDALSPLASGRPYTGLQVSRLVRDANLTELSQRSILHTPCLGFEMLLKQSSFFESVGQSVRSPFGGIMMTEAKKQMYKGSVVRPLGKLIPKVVKPVLD